MFLLNRLPRQDFVLPRNDNAGILYALHIRGQKYGFSPIFLLFLQVGQLNHQDYKESASNILADTRRCRFGRDRSCTRNPDTRSADTHC